MQVGYGKFAQLYNHSANEKHCQLSTFLFYQLLIKSYESNERYYQANRFIGLPDV